MNRNTVQRSPRGGGAGVDGHCSLPGVSRVGMRGEGHQDQHLLRADTAGSRRGWAGPHCTHTRTRRGGAQGATSARWKDTRHPHAAQTRSHWPGVPPQGPTPSTPLPARH